MRDGLSWRARPDGRTRALSNERQVHPRPERSWKPASPLRRRSPARITVAAPERPAPTPPPRRPSSGSSDTDDGSSNQPAAPDGRRFVAPPGTTPIPVFEAPRPGKSSRGSRRKILELNRAKGHDWRSLYFAGDVRIKQLVADLARVRAREAAKDADLGRLRAERVLLHERLDAKTRSNDALTASVSNIIQQALAGRFDVPAIVGVLAHTDPPPLAAAGLVAAADDVDPGTSEPDEEASPIAPSSPDFPPQVAGADVPALDVSDDEAPDLTPTSPPFSPPRDRGTSPGSPFPGHLLDALDALQPVGAAVGPPAPPPLA